MKKVLILIWCLSPLGLLAQLKYYTVTAVDSAVVYSDPVNQDLEVYLVGGNATIAYQGTIVGSYQWYQYNALGHSVELSGAVSPTLSDVNPDMGYYMTIDGVENRRVWLVDYSKAAFTSELTSPGSDDECQYVSLHFETNQLYYYTLTGQRYAVIRKFNAIYDTWNQATNAPRQMDEEVRSNKITAPLMNTPITVYDVYAQSLNLDMSITLDEYPAVAVFVNIKEELDTATVGSNIQIESGAYAAPLRAIFSAEVNPAANYCLWSVYKMDESTENPIIRYVETDPNNPLRYTFDRAGNYRVSLEVSSIGKRTQCDAKHELNYRIVESYIDVPNVFSPGTSPGVNDEFRVAFKSISKFRGYIVNRWGQKMFEWRDANMGWDGKFNGKLVPPGVYFYVIEWEGADGQKGVKKGDINIIRGR